MPYDVLTMYGAILVWIAVWLRDARRGSYGPTVAVGIVLTLILNGRYLIDGAADSIAFFVSLYDVFDNLGLGATDTAPALATCADNACSLWGERYLQHSSWGVAFHERFSAGPAWRRTLLTVHLSCNSIVFALMHYQLARTGHGTHRTVHRLIGRASFALLTAGTLAAVLLAAEHGAVAAYGGDLAKYGFWFMSLCVYGCAVRGVWTIRSGDAELHRIWMVRFVGAMWGSFWLFRAMLVVTGPLLRQWETVSILCSIWLSAPAGIAIAEWLRRRWDQRAAASSVAMPRTALSHG